MRTLRPFPVLASLAVLLLAGAVPAAPASAQVLVSNIGQTGSGSAIGLSTSDVAMGFTTGSASNTLSSIEVDFWVGTTETVTATLATGVSTTSAGTVVATLNSRGNFAAGNVAFTAPANTTLSANTTYFVIFEGDGGRLECTTSDDEDSGGQPGWSVEDSGLARSSSQTQGFNLGGCTLKIRVNSSDPSITIAAGTSPVTEGTAADFTVTASKAPSSDLTVDLTVSEFRRRLRDDRQRGFQDRDDRLGRDDGRLLRPDAGRQLRRAERRGGGEGGGRRQLPRGNDRFRQRDRQRQRRSAPGADGVRRRYGFTQQPITSVSSADTEHLGHLQQHPYV